MAATGTLLYLCLLSHLIGNLQIYLGREQINACAAFLHSHYAMLWVARIGLLAAVELTLRLASNCGGWDHTGE